MSGHNSPRETLAPLEAESPSLLGMQPSDGEQAVQGSGEEQEGEVVALRSEFDYTQLDPETRQFVEGRAIETHGLLKRTAEHITAIGSNLLAVKERLPHGQFGVWLRAEFGLSHSSALRFMQVASRLGEKFVRLTNLPVQVLYELAAPGTPDELIEEVRRGDLSPSFEALREGKAAHKLAEATRLRAQMRERALSVEQARETALKQAEQIHELTQQIEELRQQIVLREEQPPPEPIVIEKPVISPEMQAHLSTLEQQVQDLSFERKRLVGQVERLGEHNRAEFIERNEVARHQRVRQQWRSVAAAWEKSTREVSAHWPTLLDSESFGQEEWTTLHHIKEAASELAERCEKLKEARAMIVDSGLSSLS